MKVKAIYVGRYHENTQTYTLCKENNKPMKEDMEKMGIKIKALNAKAGQRNKLKTAYGPWYVMHREGWAYAVCTTEQYPERHVYGMMDKIRQLTEKNTDPKDGRFIKQLKKLVQETSTKYNDLSKVDKVHKAQAQVQLLQSDLNTGIKKLMNNQENLSELDDRAAEMKNFAREFENNCTKIESITFWQKWKFIMIITLIVLGAISLVAVTIMIKY